MKYLLLLIPSVTLATGGHDTPAPVTPPAQTQAQTQNQYQSQGQSQSANSASGASAGASAVSQAQGGAGGASTAQASNAGNQQTVVTERSAPSLGQGSFAIQGCGVAGNAGHSGTGGASFLGFGFTPRQCYDFQLAQAYAAMGAVQAACEVLNVSDAGKRARRKGVVLPTCIAAPVPVPPLVTPAQPTPPVVVNVQPSPPPQQCTKALRQCVRK